MLVLKMRKYIEQLISIRVLGMVMKVSRFILSLWAWRRILHCFRKKISYTTFFTGLITW